MIDDESAVSLRYVQFTIIDCFSYWTARNKATLENKGKCSIIVSIDSLVFIKLVRGLFKHFQFCQKINMNIFTFSYQLSVPES